MKASAVIHIQQFLTPFSDEISFVEHNTSYSLCDVMSVSKIVCGIPITFIGVTK